jgi:hypothetical protein
MSHSTDVYKVRLVYMDTNGVEAEDIELRVSKDQSQIVPLKNFFEKSKGIVPIVFTYEVPKWKIVAISFTEEDCCDGNTYANVVPTGDFETRSFSVYGEDDLLSVADKLEDCLSLLFRAQCRPPLV